jgi:CRP-like cAMP-binding protein
MAGVHYSKYRELEVESMPEGFEPKFPHGEHQDCETLTALTIDNLPQDGVLGLPRRFRRGDDVWQPGDRSDRIYFIKRGQVAIIASDRDGHEVVLRFVEMGEPFGELCFCGGPTAYRHTSARATTETDVFEIKLEDFMSYIQEDLYVLTAFVFTFCIRLAEAERRIEVLAYRGATERLGNLLLQLADARLKQGADRRGEVKLPLSHEELARMAAMSRQHVTLTLGKFRRLGLVRYERGRPLVIDTEALASYLSGT